MLAEHVSHRPRRGRLDLSALALLGVIGVSSIASAQDANLERARTLFREGVTLAEQQRWEEAAGRFRATLAIRVSPTVRFNLARALYELNEFAEADELLALVVADETAIDAQLFADAQQLRVQVAAAVGRQALQEPSAAARAGAPPTPEASAEAAVEGSLTQPEAPGGVDGGLVALGVISGLVAAAAVVVTVVLVVPGQTEAPVEGDFSPAVLSWR